MSASLFYLRPFFFLYFLFFLLKRHSTPELRVVDFALHSLLFYFPLVYVVLVLDFLRPFIRLFVSCFLLYHVFRVLLLSWQHEHSSAVLVFDWDRILKGFCTPASWNITNLGVAALLWQKYRNTLHPYRREVLRANFTIPSFRNVLLRGCNKFWVAEEEGKQILADFFFLFLSFFLAISCLIYSWAYEDVVWTSSSSMSYELVRSQMFFRQFIISKIFVSDVDLNFFS